MDCSSRIVTTICTGTTALPMINGTSVLHMPTILPCIAIVIGVQEPPTTVAPMAESGISKTVLLYDARCLDDLTATCRP